MSLVMSSSIAPFFMGHIVCRATWIACSMSRVVCWVLCVACLVCRTYTVVVRTQLQNLAVAIATATTVFMATHIIATALAAVDAAASTRFLKMFGYWTAEFVSKFFGSWSNIPSGNCLWIV